MARGPKFYQHWQIKSRTQALLPQKANIIYFDVCAVKAKNSIYQHQDIVNACRGLAWEKTYMPNDKYMCRKDSCSCNGTV
jgi:hypothetical protein